MAMRAIAYHYAARSSFIPIVYSVRKRRGVEAQDPGYSRLHFVSGLIRMEAKEAEEWTI
jgi:hypothetical protein